MPDSGAAGSVAGSECARGDGRQQLDRIASLIGAPARSSPGHGKSSSTRCPSARFQTCARVSWICALVASRSVELSRQARERTMHLSANRTSATP